MLSISYYDTILMAMSRNLPTIYVNGVRLLIEHTADTTLKNNGARDALDLAIPLGDYEVRRLITEMLGRTGSEKKSVQGQDILNCSASYCAYRGLRIMVIPLIWAHTQSLARISCHMVSPFNAGMLLSRP